MTTLHPPGEFELDVEVGPSEWDCFQLMNFFRDRKMGNIRKGGTAANNQHAWRRERLDWDLHGTLQPNICDEGFRLLIFVYLKAGIARLDGKGMCIWAGDAMIMRL